MNNPDQLQNILPPTPIGGIIPVDQAITETTRWRDHQLLNGGIGSVKAFFIPLYDLQCLLEYYKMYNPTGVRAYMGISDAQEPGSNAVRLLLVPATIDEDFWDKGSIPPGGEMGSSIYDFTAPCPDTCSTTNPLNPD